MKLAIYQLCFTKLPTYLQKTNLDSQDQTPDTQLLGKRIRGKRKGRDENYKIGQNLWKWNNEDLFPKISWKQIYWNFIICNTNIHRIVREGRVRRRFQYSTSHQFDVELVSILFFKRPSTPHFSESGKLPMTIFGKCEEMWSGKGFEELGKDELLPIKWYTGIETNKIMMRKKHPTINYWRIF